MSDTPVTPARPAPVINVVTPPLARPVSLFTIVGLFILFAAFLLVIRYFYHPVETPAFVDTPENLSKDLQWRADRASRRKTLEEVRATETQKLTGYGWVDQKAGVVQLPIDRAIELTARDLAAKQPARGTRDLPTQTGPGTKF